MTYPPHPWMFSLAAPPSAGDKKTPAQNMLDFVGGLLAGLESRVMLEEQRRALAASIGGFHGTGMPEAMSDKEFKEAREIIQRYRQFFALAPLISALTPEQLEVFYLLFLAGSEVESAVGQAKEGLGIEGKIAILKSFQERK